jgi:hypothetical protein
MARSFEFSIVRLAPHDVRDERLNVGIVVLRGDGLDVRLSRRLEKVRAISAKLDVTDLKDLLSQLQPLEARLAGAGWPGVITLRQLPRLGPLTFSEPGTFVAETDSAYEDRIASIMSAMIDPEPAPARVRQKRSRLLTQLKQAFRKERVLARPGEDLGSHRIVPTVEVDRGLVADLVLKNGVLHVVESVDASSETEPHKRALADIGLSALVLERARMKYGENVTTQLVYSASPSLEALTRPSLEAAEHQGATLVNWMSERDRERFVHHLSSLAEPVPSSRKRGQGDTAVRFI